MRHLLHDPHFPDIVGEWANEPFEAVLEPADCANDNAIGEIGELGDPFLTMIAKMDIAATRAW